jgi:cytidylate kinase
MSAVPVIAIDGLDSGALYRLVAIAAVDAGIDAEDHRGLARAAEQLDFSFRHEGQEIIPYLNGKDVSRRLRTEDISNMASKVASVPSVRSAMVGRQRAFVKAPGLVADGRDMGTIIFPDAILKIFLTASVEIRARRRYKQLKDKGESVNLRRLFREIEARDERDTTREIAPLEDAVVIDSTESSINEVLDKVYLLSKERLLSI